MVMILIGGKTMAKNANNTVQNARQKAGSQAKSTNNSNRATDSTTTTQGTSRNKSSGQKMSDCK